MKTLNIMNEYLVIRVFSRYKYNVLAAFSLMISVCNFLLIYLIYGSDKSADAYFLLTNGINVIFLIVESLISNYSYDFRMIVNTDVRRSAYSTMLVLSLVVSTLMSILFLFQAPYIFDLVFSNEIGGAEREIFIYFIHVASLYLILQLNINSLNAINKIGLGYLFSFLPQLFSLSSLITIYFFEGDSYVGNVIGFLMLGYAFSIFSSTLFCYRLIGLTTRLNFQFSFEVVKKSIKSRSASNIHNIFINYFTVLIVSSAGSGMASTFYYGKRVAEMFHLVIFGPFSKQMVNKVSDSWSKRDFKAYSELKIFVIQKLPKIYLSILSLILISLWIVVAKLGVLSVDYQYIGFVISAFFVANVVISIESLYSLISMITASFKKIAIANVSFVVVTVCVQRLCMLFYSEIYSLCISIIVGQVVVLMCHFVMNRNMISKHYGV